jgi:hypothetical protein
MFHAKLEGFRTEPVIHGQWPWFPDVSKTGATPGNIFLTEIRGIIPAEPHSLIMGGHRVYAAYYAAAMMFQEWRGD